LTIRVDNGHGRVSTWKLLCDPPGGDHPGPAAACEALARHGAAALPPVPSNQMCTQIYAGPETASIEGSWRGAQVSSQLSRIDGCQEQRWQRLKDVVNPR